MLLLSRLGSWDEHVSSHVRCLPYVFLAGMDKCGSTDLYKLLIKHPMIHPGPIKELHYWNKIRYFSNQFVLSFKHMCAISQ